MASINTYNDSFTKYDNSPKDTIPFLRKTNSMFKGLTNEQVNDLIVMATAAAPIAYKAADLSVEAVSKMLNHPVVKREVKKAVKNIKQENEKRKKIDAAYKAKKKKAANKASELNRDAAIEKAQRASGVSSNQNKIDYDLGRIDEATYKANQLEIDKDLQREINKIHKTRPVTGPRQDIPNSVQNKLRNNLSKTEASLAKELSRVQGKTIKAPTAAGENKPGSRVLNKLFGTKASTNGRQVSVTGKSAFNNAIQDYRRKGIKDPAIEKLLKTRYTQSKSIANHDKQIGTDKPYPKNKTEEVIKKAQASQNVGESSLIDSKGDIKNEGVGTVRNTTAEPTSLNHKQNVARASIKTESESLNKVIADANKTKDQFLKNVTGTENHLKSVDFDENALNKLNAKKNKTTADFEEISRVKKRLVKNRKALKKAIESDEHFVKEAAIHEKRAADATEAKEKLKRLSDQVLRMNKTQIAKTFNEDFTSVYKKGDGIHEVFSNIRKNVKSARNIVLNEAGFIEGKVKDTIPGTARKLDSAFTDTVDKIRAEYDKGKLSWDKAEYKIRKQLGELSAGDKINKLLGKYVPKFVDVKDDAVVQKIKEGKINPKQAHESGFFNKKGKSYEELKSIADAKYPNDPKKAEAKLNDDWNNQEAKTAFEAEQQKKKHAAYVAKKKAKVNKDGLVTRAVKGTAKGAFKLGTLGTGPAAIRATKGAVKGSIKAAPFAAPLVGANMYANTRDYGASRGVSAGKQAQDFVLDKHNYFAKRGDELLDADKWVGDETGLTGGTKMAYDLADTALSFPAQAAVGGYNLLQRARANPDEYLSDIEQNNPNKTTAEDRLDSWMGYGTEYNPQDPNIVEKYLPFTSNYMPSNYSVSHDQNVQKAADILGIDLYPTRPDGKVNESAKTEAIKAAESFVPAMTDPQNESIDWSDEKTRSANIYKSANNYLRTRKDEELDRSDIALKQTFDNWDPTGNFSSQFNTAKLGVDSNDLYVNIPEKQITKSATNVNEPSVYDKMAMEAAGVDTSTQDGTTTPPPPVNTRSQLFQQIDKAGYRPWERIYPEEYKPNIPEEMQAKYNTYEQNYDPNSEYATPNEYKSLLRYGNEDFAEMSVKDRAKAMLAGELKGGNEALYSNLNASSGYLSDNHPTQIKRRAEANRIHQQRLASIGQMQRARMGEQFGLEGILNINSNRAFGGLTANQMRQQANADRNFKYQKSQDLINRSNKQATDYSTMSDSARSDLALQRYNAGHTDSNTINELYRYNNKNSDNNYFPGFNGRPNNEYAHPKPEAISSENDDNWIFDGVDGNWFSSKKDKAINQAIRDNDYNTTQPQPPQETQEQMFSRKYGSGANKNDKWSTPL